LKDNIGPSASLLRPVLDTYMDSAVAVIGCNSRGLARYTCEYDLLIVASDRRPPTSIRVRESYADLTFVSEKDVLKPRNPEHALSLASARPVRDTSLVLSTASATSTATHSESAAKAAGIRLASALKILGRAEVALARKALTDADFWLLAGSYEYAYALLLSRESLPCPSHLLAQLRELSRGTPQGFEGVSIGAGLEAASRAGCGARQEGVVVLHDLLREGQNDASDQSPWTKARTEILVAKSAELVTRVELAECYSFLGQETVDDMATLLKRHPKRSLTSLTAGKDRLLGERLMRQLGLARTEGAIRTGLDILKGQVSVLTRKSA